MKPIELKPFVGEASALLKVMGNEHRLMVLCYLSDGERSVGQLEVMIGLSQSALSQHLAKLRRDKLVATRRDRQTIYYSLASNHAVSVMRTLCEAFARPLQASIGNPMPA
ncbi:MAG TPA: metalloregulator ArsR/SmtB family transcription factor [Stellaceae bacterium]|nr:metalloregulator ArsR/SmtB family transcription factor [Stellaceae bacterium]